MQEYNKEEAKQNKIKQIETTTAAAVLQRVMKECQIDIEYYQTDKSTVLVIPIGDGGVEIGLSNRKVTKWKNTLPGLFMLIAKQAVIQEVLQYCKEHRLTVLGKEAKKYIVFPEDLKVIHRFSISEDVESVFFHNNVKVICKEVFRACSSLRSVEIPNSVTEIGESAFVGCLSLTDIRYNGTKEEWNKVNKGEDCFRYIGTHFVHCSDGDAELLCEVIDGNVFKKCLRLLNKDYVIPDGITKIGKFAFFFFQSLTSVEIPGSVTKIGKSAFRWCSSLTSINLPNGVTEIGESAFSICEDLKSVDLPGSLTKIGKWAFANNYFLTDIRYSGTKAQWKEIEKGEEWCYNSHIETVHCTDGDIAISGEQREKEQ